MFRIHLVDDGTLDTVLACRDCGRVERYNFWWDSEGEPFDEDESLVYDDWVSELLQVHNTNHVCGDDDA